MKYLLLMGRLSWPAWLVLTAMAAKRYWPNGWAALLDVLLLVVGALLGLATGAAGVHQAWCDDRERWSRLYGQSVTDLAKLIPVPGTIQASTSCPHHPDRNGQARQAQ